MSLFYRKPFSLCCFFFICGALLGFFAFENIRKFALVAFTAIGIVMGMIALIRKKSEYFFSAVLPMLFAIIGILYFVLYSARLDGYTDKYVGDDKYKIESTVLSRSFISNYLSIYELRTHGIDDEKVNIKMRLEVPFYLELAEGDRIGISVYLSDFEIVNGFDQKHYYNSKGVYLLASADGTECNIIGRDSSLELFFGNLSRRFGDIFDKHLDEESAGLVKAVFLGNRDGLSDTAKRDFKRTGGYHLLALSGMHLAVLTAILNGFLAFLKVKKSKRYIILTVLIIFYVALTGFCLSMVRSAIMLLATYLAFFLRSRKDMFAALTFAAASILVCSPSAIGDIGFWMSVLATFGILISLSFETFVRFKLRRISVKWLRKIIRYTASTLIISFAAILMTLPFSCFCFRAISLVGPVVTLILSNIVSLILVLAPLHLMFSWLPIFSSAIVFLIELTSRFILWISGVFSEIENIYVSLDYEFVEFLVFPFFLIFAIFLVVNLKHKIIIPIFALVWVMVFSVLEYNALNDPLTRMKYIRLGQNEYICLSTSGENTLIDISDGSGGKLSTAANEAVRKGFCEIDAVILTHLHKRHVNSLKQLASDQTVRKVIIPKPINDDESSVALSINYEMELLGVETLYYKADEALEIHGTILKSEHAYIKRSSHPIIKLEFDGAIDLLYIGSSYYEYGTAGSSENIIIGTHGPICKKDFTVDGSRASLISIADEELISFAEVKDGEKAKIIKNTELITLICE